LKNLKMTNEYLTECANDMVEVHKTHKFFLRLNYVTDRTLRKVVGQAERAMLRAMATTESPTIVSTSDWPVL